MAPTHEAGDPIPRLVRSPVPSPPRNLHLPHLSPPARCATLEAHCSGCSTTIPAGSKCPPRRHSRSWRTCHLPRPGSAPRTPLHQRHRRHKRAASSRPPGATSTVNAPIDKVWRPSAKSTANPPNSPVSMPSSSPGGESIARLIISNGYEGPLTNSAPAASPSGAPARAPSSSQSRSIASTAPVSR